MGWTLTAAPSKCPWCIKVTWLPAPTKERIFLLLHNMATFGQCAAVLCIISNFNCSEMAWLEMDHNYSLWKSFQFEPFPTSSLPSSTDKGGSHFLWFQGVGIVFFKLQISGHFLVQVCAIVLHVTWSLAVIAGHSGLKCPISTMC